MRRVRSGVENERVGFGGDGGHNGIPQKRCRINDMAIRKPAFLHALSNEERIGNEIIKRTAQHNRIQRNMTPGDVTIAEMTKQVV